MRKTIAYLFLLIIFSCSGKKPISYDKARSLYAKKGYQVRLNNQDYIDFNYYYFDKDHISTIVADRKNKTIELIQSNQNMASFNLTEIAFEQFKSVSETQPKDSIALIVINGTVVDRSDWENYYIEYAALKSVNIVKDSDSSVMRCGENNEKPILILSTE